MEFGNMATNPKQEDKDSKLTAKTASSEERDRSRKRDLDRTYKENVVAHMRAFPLSNLEQEEQDAMQIKLKFEKSKLLEKIEHMISSFDTALQHLRRKSFWENLKCWWETTTHQRML